MAMVMAATAAWATINPKAYYTKDGEEVVDSVAVTGEAPLLVRFEANASDLEAGSTLEWRFVHNGVDGQNTYVRYEENPEHTFTESGLTRVTLIVRYQEEVVDSASINVTISESHLEMPNAFSPNDDGGQKLYEWTNIDEGWDGTYNGSPVKDGVYFVLVNARGADGKEYNIRRDVNLIRRHNDDTNNSEQ